MLDVSAQIAAVVADVSRSTQGQIAAEAKRLNAEIMNTDPRPINFVRHVDGVEGVDETAVKPGGIIVYDYNRLDLVAKDALRLLRENSPVGGSKSPDPHPGLYRDSHRLYLNLRPVDDLSAWKPGDEISITNLVPYARVIELNSKGGKSKFKVSGGGHVYEKTVRALQRAYREIADIQFTFRAVLGGGQVDQLGAVSPKLGNAAAVRDASGRFAKGNRNMARAGGVQAHNRSEARWPTITINPAGSFYVRAGLH